MSNIKSVGNNALRTKEQKKPRSEPMQMAQGQADSRSRTSVVLDRSDRVELSAAAQELLKKHRKQIEEN